MVMFMDILNKENDLDMINTDLIFFPKLLVKTMIDLLPGEEQNVVFNVKPEFYTKIIGSVQSPSTCEVKYLGRAVYGDLLPIEIISAPAGEVTAIEWRIYTHEFTIAIKNTGGVDDYFGVFFYMSVL